MATQSEEEKKRTGQVEQGNAKPGETSKDTTVRQQTPEPPRVPVLAYDLYSDSPAIANRGTGTAVQPAQARPNTGTNYVRPQSPQDRLNESYQNSHNRWEAEKARRAQFRADHEGRNEWQQREYEAYDKRLKERRQRIQQFNDNVQRGNFEGMTRISDDNWSKMGEGSATAQSGWKMNADGKTIALDENGKPVRETSYTVEGKIDHNSEENVKNRAALEEWSKNQWKTNFNNGVAFNRYDGGFDTSKLPKGVFDKDGNLDLSKITSQKQMNALMQIMRQDQEATGARGRKPNAEQAAAQVVKDLKASGLSDEQIAGMSTAQKTAARDQFKLNSASKALEAFYKADAENRKTQGASGPVSQSMLDARLALREAGFTDKQVRQMMGGDSSPLRGRLEAQQARQAQQRQAGVTLRGDNPAAREIEAEVRNQLETGALKNLPTVEQATPKPREADDGDIEAHRKAMEGVDLNANPFADEDAAAAWEAEGAAARQAAAANPENAPAEPAVPGAAVARAAAPYDARAAFEARRDAMLYGDSPLPGMMDMASRLKAARDEGRPSLTARTRDHVPLLSRDQYRDLVSDLPTPTEAAGRAFEMSGSHRMAALMKGLETAEQMGAAFATGNAGRRGLRTPTDAQVRRGVAEGRQRVAAQGTRGEGVIEMGGVSARRQAAQERQRAAARGQRGEGVIVPPVSRRTAAAMAQDAAARGTQGEGVVTSRPRDAEVKLEAAARGTQGEGVITPPLTPEQARAAGRQGTHERNPERQQKRQTKIQNRAVARQEQAVAREEQKVLDSYQRRVNRIKVPRPPRAKGRKRR